VPLLTFEAFRHIGDQCFISGVRGDFVKVQMKPSFLGLAPKKVGTMPPDCRFPECQAVATLCTEKHFGNARMHGRVVRSIARRGDASGEKSAPRQRRPDYISYKTSSSALKADRNFFCESLDCGGAGKRRVVDHEPEGFLFPECGLASRLLQVVVGAGICRVTGEVVGVRWE